MNRATILAVMLAILGLFGAACGGEVAEDQHEAKLTVTEGQLAPDFSLPGVAGDTVSLRDFHGEQNVLLYFSMGAG